MPLITQNYIHFRYSILGTENILNDVINTTVIAFSVSELAFSSPNLFKSICNTESMLEEASIKGGRCGG